MNILTKQWVNALFDDGEYTCMGNKWENKIFPVTKLLLEQEEYVSINPMKRGTTRKGVNVTHFRNFLFEMDEFNKKDQLQIIANSKLPVTTLVDSGNKSIHFILSLETPLEDRTTYTAYFKAIKKGLEKYGAVVDPACKDPGRFTRAPFGTRSSNGKQQKVLKIKSRVKNYDLHEWFRKQDIDPMDFIDVPTVRTSNGTSNAQNQLKIDWVEKFIMSKQPPYEDGNYNYQYTMACALLRTGMSADAIESYYISKWNHIHENNPIKGALETVKAGEEIYVPTMEERKEYYRQLDEQETLMHARKGYDRPEIKEKIEARPEDLDRYIVVGTEYFKIDSITDKLIPWTKTMFEKMYSARAIPNRLYDKFGYKPDYISDEFPYDLEIDRKTRNMFMRPQWKIKPGKWDTIEGGLRHGFGDQYELILKYCAILIAYPEAKLPGIWFLGPEGKGKSAIVAIFRMLVGEENYKKVSGKQLESDFTDFLAAKQLVVVEEAGNWKNPGEVMSNLKDWITETSKQTVNPKYGKQFESPVHCKFMFTSNDYNSIPDMGEGTRMWIVEIDKEPTQKVDNYYQKIAAEMGHFVNYLVKEIVPTLKMKDGTLDTTDRLYFHPSEYETDIKDWVKDANKTPLQDEIEDALSDFFETFSDQDTCYFDLKSLMEKIKSGNTIGKKELKVCLKSKFGLEPSNPLQRPDSLRWQKEYAQMPDRQPSRHTRWFCVERSSIIDDALFCSDTQFA